MPLGFSVFREEWRPVSGYEGSYEVSNFGRIRSLDRSRRYRHGLCRVHGQVLDLSSSNSGYLLVGACKNGKAQKLNVHILVAEAFLGSRPSGFVVHHLDADKRNNFAWNLAYVSRRENIEYGNLLYGESHRCAKLKTQEIPIIRDLAEKGFSSKLISKMFDVSSATIWAIVNGKTWKRAR